MTIIGGLLIGAGVAVAAQRWHWSTRTEIAVLVGACIGYGLFVWAVS